MVWSGVSPWWVETVSELLQSDRWGIGVVQRLRRGTDLIGEPADCHVVITGHHQARADG